MSGRMAVPDKDVKVNGVDNAIWISWYDLKEDGRDAYLAWLHEIYIPLLLRRPGFLWAAHYASVDKARVISSRA